MDTPSIATPIVARFATALIVFMLLSQVAAILIRTGSHAWPFTNYPMYASAHFENERLKVRNSVYALFADGTEHLISERDIVGIQREEAEPGKEVTANPGNIVDAFVRFTQRKRPRWLDCSLRPGGSCVLFHNFLAASIIRYPEDRYVLKIDTPEQAVPETNRNWLYVLLRSVVSRQHIASRHIDLFTSNAEKNLAKTIVAYRVEDYPATITRNGWAPAEPAQVLKTLHIVR